MSHLVSLCFSPRSLLGLVLGLSMFAAVQLANRASAESLVQTVLIAGVSGKCLAVDPADGSNGAAAFQWTCGAGYNIQIEDAGDGWHYIRFMHSGKCLTVRGYADENGAALEQWDCLGQANQKWSGNFNAGGFELHGSQAFPDKCMTVNEASRADGAPVNQWDCMNVPNQAWLITTVVVPMEGTDEFKQALAEEKQKAIAAAAAATQETLNAVIAAWNAGDADAFADFWTDQAWEANFGFPKSEIDQFAPYIGLDQITVNSIIDIEVGRRLNTSTAHVVLTVGQDGQELLFSFESNASGVQIANLTPLVP